MKSTILSILLSITCFSAYSQSDGPFKGYIYNKEYKFSFLKLLRDLAAVFGVCVMAGLIAALVIIASAPKYDYKDVYSQIDTASIVYDDQGKQMQPYGFFFSVRYQMDDGCRHKRVVHTDHQYPDKGIPFLSYSLIEHTSNSKCGCSKNHNVNYSDDSAQFFHIYDTLLTVDYSFRKSSTTRLNSSGFLFAIK